MGGFALLLRWLTPLQAASCAAAALAFNVVLLHRITRRRLLREGERGRGFSLGIALYPAAVLGSIVVFRNRLELAAATWGLIAFGDGMAAVAGTIVGGPRLPWNPRKTWAGFLAFVLWGTAAAAFLLRWVQQGALGGDGASWIGGSFLGAGAGVEGWDRAALLTGCLVAALAAAFAESLRTGIDDNIAVPVVGGAVLYAATLVDASTAAAAWPAVRANLLAGAAVNAVLALAALAARGVSRSGAVSGWILGTLLFGFGGWRGFSMLLVFFVLGTTCTKLGYAKKAALGIAQERGGRRGARNAVANTTAGVVFAILAALTPHTGPFTLALVAAFATAASDTVASEIGQAYGRTHYLVTTFRRVKAGTDGAVSLEGTLAGILGSLIVGGIAWLTGMIGPTSVAIVAVAAFFGSMLESYLGATFEAMKLVDNEVVNFANTVAGGLAAIAVSAIL